MTRNRVLAALAIALGIAAAVTGSPEREGSRIDVAELARTIEREDDHVTAIELASWIHDRRPRLRIYDLSTAEDFERYHIPTARHARLYEVVVKPREAGETIVLYSRGGVHAAQAWVLLRSSGREQVWFLSGGLEAWMAEVMSPALPPDLPPAERARISALSRYFGGIPRQGDASGVAQPVHDAVEAVRRRGC